MGRPIGNGFPSCLLNVAFESTDLQVCRTRLLCWNTSVSIVLQKSVVPWLVALFGLEYPVKTTADVVRQMVAALVKRDNIKGLAERYDQLAEQFPETVEAIADAVKYTAGPVGSAMPCCLSYH